MAAQSLGPISTPLLAPTIALTLEPSGPTPTPFMHIVQQGETLLGIAIQYGVTLDELLLVNPGVDPRILSVGQNLQIPGPGGEPLDTLLPVPTPVMLQLGQVYCYPTIVDRVRCLCRISNTLAAPVEGIAVQISILDSNGELLDQIPAYSMMRFLSDGQSIVLESTFDTDLSDIAIAQAELISAVQVSSLQDRLVQVQVSNLEVEQLAENRLYRLKGLLELQETEREGQVLLMLQAIGYNAEGEPIGMNVLQFKLGSADFPQAFELSLFSLSGEIDEFNLLLEAQPLLEAE